MHFTPSRVACALVFLLSSAITPSVLAHAHLKQQSPQENTVAVAPEVITLNFSEGIEPAFSGVVVTGAVKRDEKDNAKLIVPLEKPLTSGTYTVDWHVVSVDGHKTKGSYHFSVK